MAQQEHTDRVQVNLKAEYTGDRSHPFYVQTWFPIQPPASSPCLLSLPPPTARPPPPRAPTAAGPVTGFLLPLSPPPACYPHIAREIPHGCKADHAASWLCPVLQKMKASLHPPDSKVLHRSETLSRLHPDLRHTAQHTPTGLPVVSSQNLPGQVLPCLRLYTYCSFHPQHSGPGPSASWPLCLWSFLKCYLLRDVPSLLEGALSYSLRPYPVCFFSIIKYYLGTFVSLLSFSLDNIFNKEEDRSCHIYFPIPNT